MVTKAAQTISFRASDPERDLVQQVADHSGQNMSAFVRTVLMQYCDAYIEDVGLDKFLDEVRAIAEERERVRQREEAQARAAEKRQAEVARRQSELTATLARGR